MTDKNGNVINEPRIPAKADTPSDFANHYKVPADGNIPVYAPLNFNPQDFVDQSIANGLDATLPTYKTGGSQDFKNVYLTPGNIYDGLGNYMYGFEMAKFGVDYRTTQAGAGGFRLLGDLFHGRLGKIAKDDPETFMNNPTNAAQIYSGYSGGSGDTRLTTKEVPCPQPK